MGQPVEVRVFSTAPFCFALTGFAEHVLLRGGEKQNALRSLGGARLLFGGAHRLHYVYLLVSEANPDKRYVGVTSDL